MRLIFPILALALVAACEPTEPEAPKGPAIEVVEAARALDRTRVAMRYKNGSPIAADDVGRAMGRAMSIACKDGESAIADTTSREGGLLTAHVFCVTVLTTDQEIDGSGLRS